MEHKKQKIITLGGIKFLAINLSEPLREDVEVFPGDPKPVKKVFSDIDKTGYEHYVYSVSDHNFHPHGDAPSHQNRGMKSYEGFDMNYFFNPACIIDISDSSEAEEHEGIKYLVQVTKKHLSTYSEIISKKNAVIIRTGYDRWLEANKKHNINKTPYLSKEAGEFLAGFKNIKVIGIDSLTVDAPECHDVHQLFKEKLIVESLVNLYNIPEESKNNFDLQTSTIAIVGASGGPVTAFAFIRAEKED
ncbi:cyclase family protein [Candidatus Woesearchaeota archaeon]|jgi:arylformamidase|nr:cyclase family protein [Candidatus Woesearchaeota archaeon]MBT5342379.1 cyclase family protein [Candidatus Woesearchaeota archaeon]